jgi:hypothetical protein
VTNLDCRLVFGNLRLRVSVQFVMGDHSLDPLLIPPEGIWLRCRFLAQRRNDRWGFGGGPEVVVPPSAP